MIMTLKERYPISVLCQAFDVHRSSYKYWYKRHETTKPEQLKERAMVKAIFTESQGSAGARTIARVATDRGFALSRYRAGRLMKYCQLESCQQAKHTYKKAEHAHVEIPNRLDRQFDVSAPNQV
jgi:putative transposase